MKRKYRDFPKADSRRYFLVLLAVDRLKERATLHYLAQEVDCTRAEVQRALEAAAIQFGVVYGRAGPVYAIVSWGVLIKSRLVSLVSCPGGEG